MSYTIGQFRKDMLGNYLNQISMTKREIHTSPSGISGDIYFKDAAFSMTNSFDYQKNYYIKIQIKRTNTDQNFSISLANLDSEENSEQFLKRFYVPAIRGDKDINKTAIIEIVFNPIINFSDVVIRLNRTSRDYSIENPDGSSGRVFEIVDDGCACYEIINIGCACYEIINILNSIPSVTAFDKIGVQGPSGLLMCINGEEIRVTPSGIYETRSGYKINFMGFVVTDPSPNVNYFILDYQY